MIITRRKVYISLNCQKILLKLPPDEVGMFRFLMEARDNLAMFTVLDRRLALLKLLFAPESGETVIKALEEIGRDIKMEWTDWPV